MTPHQRTPLLKTSLLVPMVSVIEGFKCTCTCTCIIMILGNSTLPWPTRLYESNDCVIELSMGFKLQQSSTHQFFEKAECNYMCVLHRYHSDGTHTKIDLRKILRKERKKVNNVESTILITAKSSTHTYMYMYTSTCLYDSQPFYLSRYLY